MGYRSTTSSASRAPTGRTHPSIRRRWGQTRASSRSRKRSKSKSESFLFSFSFSFSLVKSRPFFLSVFRFAGCVPAFLFFGALAQQSLGFEEQRARTGCALGPVARF